MRSNVNATAERQLSPISIYLPIVGPIVVALLLNLPSLVGPIRFSFLNEPLLMNLTFFAYLVGAVLVMAYLFQREEVFLGIASWLTIIGFTLHTTAFVLRWIEVGRPPYGGINEVVLSFAWALVLINLVVTHTTQVKFVNFVTLPLAAIAVFLSVIFPTERTGFLVPALQSYWLYIHVSFAMFSYPTFAVSFAIAVLYLIKDRVRPESFGLAIMGLVALIYLSLNGFSLIGSGKYHLDGFANGQPIFVAPETPLKVPIPSVGPIFIAAFVLSAIAFVLYWISLKNERFGRAAYRAVLLSLPVQVGGLILLFYRIKNTPMVSFSSNPFELTGLVAAPICSALLCLLTAKREAIIQFLPDKDRLDNLVYKTITFGFPLLCLQIITGAIWAGEAWGRYWGWDPKETWALITALIYAAYLHMRMTRGWTGRRNVYLAIIGFASVLFTYLGVTYLLSGLHSYK